MYNSMIQHSRWRTVHVREIFHLKPAYFWNIIPAEGTEQTFIKELAYESLSTQSSYLSLSTESWNESLLCY